MNTPFETQLLKDAELYNQLHKKLNPLGGKLNRFISSVEAQHNSTLKEDSSTYNE